MAKRQEESPRQERGRSWSFSDYVPFGLKSEEEENVWPDTDDERYWKEEEASLSGTMQGLGWSDEPTTVPQAPLRVNLRRPCPSTWPVL